MAIGERNTASGWTIVARSLRSPSAIIRCHVSMVRATAGPVLLGGFITMSSSILWVVMSARLDAEVGHGAASGARDGRLGATSPTGDPHVGFRMLLQVAGPLAVTTDRRDDKSV